MASRGERRAAQVRVDDHAGGVDDPHQRGRGLGAEPGLQRGGDRLQGAGEGGLVSRRRDQPRLVEDRAHDAQ